MSNEQEKKYGQFYDALTGEMITRELTPEEIEIYEVSLVPLGEPE